MRAAFQLTGVPVRQFLLAIWLAMAAAPAQTPVPKILPLGDSITRGSNSIGYPNGDIPGGYRRELSNRLTAAGLAFDFVGTVADNAAPGMDPDHGGIDGARTDQILANLPTSLALSPDIVLLKAGTTDVIQGVSIVTAAENLDTLIGAILSAEPGRKLYVATIPPFAQSVTGRTAAQLNAEATDYNSRLRNVVRQHANLGKKVFLVEMNATIVLTDPTDPTKNFFQPGDGIHPGQAGYNQMGTIWFNAFAATGYESLVNGGFELDFTGWASTGNVAIQSTTSTDGLKSAVFHSQNTTANGVLSQVFPTIAGATYDLAFDVGASGGSDANSLLVKLQGADELASLGTAVSGASGGGITWHPQSLSFVADGAITSITFTDRSTATTAAGLRLDHLRLTRRSASQPPVESPWAPLRIHSQNPRLLEFRGQPTVLRTFAEHYSSVINADFDFVPYLDTLERDGMNLTRAFLVGFRHDGSGFPATPLAPPAARYLQPWLRSSNTGPALDGLGKWDFTTWNEEYFARLRDFAQACSDHGVVAEITLFCPPYNLNEWRISPFNPSNNMQGYGPADRYDGLRGTNSNLMAAQEAAVRRIVSELNGFDNLYFEILNEPSWNEPNIKDGEEVAFQNRMLEVIRETEAALPNKHLVAHNFPQQAAAMSPGFEVINEHYPIALVVQGPNPSIAGAEALLRDHYQRERVLALDETDTDTPLQTRLESWMFLIGGGAIYNGLDVPHFVYSAQNEAGDSELGRAFRKAVRDAGNYVDNLHLVALRRDLSWVASGIPVGATLQAMGSPGQQYVAYFHHGQSGGLGNFSYDPINSSNHVITPVVTLPAGSWRAEWVRPVDQGVLRTEEFNHAGGNRSLGAVTYQEDIALRIDRTGAGDTTPPPAPAGLSATSGAAGFVNLSWHAVRSADLAFYRVYRSEDPVIPIDTAHRIATVQATVTEFSDTSTVAGDTYHYLLTAVDQTGNESAPGRGISITPTLDNLGYGVTAWQVPGRIQAEDFDNGGEGVAYHDLTLNNEAGLYRPDEGVDIETTDDAGGGHQVYQIRAGEWLEYTVQVASTSRYTFELRAANTIVGGQVNLAVDGVPVAVMIQIPPTGDTSGWQTVTVPGIVMPAGRHLLRLTLATSSPECAINWFSFTTEQTTGPTANAGQDLQIVDQDNSGSEPVTLNATASTPGDSPIQSHNWLENGATLATGITPVITLATGNHIIQLKVRDNYGLESTDEVRVTVRPGGFVNGSFESGLTGWTSSGNLNIESSVPYLPTDGSKLVAFNGANRTPNAVLSQTFATAVGGGYTLDFDAGVLSYNTNSQSMQVTVNGTGNLLTRVITINGLGGGSSRWLAQSFSFVANSTTTTLTFRDLSTTTNSLDLALDNARVSGPPPVIPNAAPLAVQDAYTTNEAGYLTVSANGILANDTDADGNPLTAVLYSGPTRGTLSLNSNGGFNYTPNPGVFGTDTFIYHANDGTANSGLATVTLTIRDLVPPPVAVADAYEVDQNATLWVPSAGVLTNDSDPDSRPLTAVRDAGPDHGTLALNPNGSFTYTPERDYFGTDSFTYHANNGMRNSESVTVAISLTVDGVIPTTIAVADSFSTNEGGTLIVPANGVLANDTGATPSTLTAVTYTDPLHGTLVLATDGGFTYAPAPGFFGADSFSYHASNGGTNSNITTVSLFVNEVIPPPVAMSDAYSTDGNTTLMIPTAGVLTNDSDPRSRPLTAVIDTLTTHGTLTLDPSGSFIYTPVPGYSGNDAFTYHASNGTRDSNTATVSITIREIIPTGLVNGSFEAGFTGWTATGNLDIQSTALYAPTEGVKLVGFNGSNRTPNAVISQAFATVAGQTYTLAFDTGVLSYNSSTQIIVVTVTGTGSLLSRTITLIGNGGGTCLWSPRSYTFVANSTTTTLTFRDASTVTNSLDLTLDNVRIIPQISRSLAVSSVPITAGILLSPPDNNGLDGGPSGFMRSYSNEAVVDVIASPVAGFRFERWLSNGVNIGTNPSISMVMNADIGLTAVYSEIVPALPTGLKIMPLGDSITYGYNGSNAGYRGPLYNLLAPDAPDFQYIGTMIHNTGSLPTTPIDQRFHQGLPSYTIDDVTNNLDGFDDTRFRLHSGVERNPAGGYWLTGGNGTGRAPMYPDVMMLMIGTNDLYAQTGVETRLRNLLNKITILRPSTRLIVAKITPSPSLSATVTSYNAIVGTVVAELKSAGRNIHLVDLHTGFPTNGLDSDAVHPNNIGFNWMALQWQAAILGSYAGIDPHGPPVITARPIDVTTVTGGSATFRVTAAGAAPLAYEWRFNGSPVSGGNSSTLVINPVSNGHAGTYQVIVTNAVGSITSSPSNLNVLQQVTTLSNGSFEAGLDGWTVTGNVMIRTISAPYNSTNGTKIAVYNSSNSSPNGALSQILTTTAGVSYTIAFDIGILAYNTSVQRLHMTCIGQASLLDRRIDMIGTGNGTTRWLPQSHTFVADGATTTLTFRDISPTTNSIDLLLDNVRLTGTTAAMAMSALVNDNSPAAPAVRMGPAPRTLTQKPVGLPIESPSLSGPPGNTILRLKAASPGIYVLERSKDLVTWETIDTRSISEVSLIEFQDISTTPAAAIFYRIGRQDLPPGSP